MGQKKKIVAITKCYGNKQIFSRKRLMSFGLICVKEFILIDEANIKPLDNSLLKEWFK